MSILVLSASSLAQNHAFGEMLNFSMPDASAGNFAILASTYANTLPGTVITGDLGYTKGPVQPVSVSGHVHVNDGVYAQAGAFQNNAISFANSKICTTSFNTSVDLSLVQGGVYTPGVYCIKGAASIGPGGITLSGNGIYIFKIGGALVTASNSAVNLSNGAQSSYVSWVPAGATTLGTNSNFAGIILDASGVTLGNNVSMTGKILAFGGTVSTNVDTITVSQFVIADAVADGFQCTITFPTGTIDLGSNVQYPDKVYSPGVYCIDGTANIGSGPITLTGNGAHIFKINGALNQAANTDVILSNGAKVSGVMWIPTGPTTIGANSHLIGTVNGAPITIGANSDINGIGPAKVMADKISGNFQCTFTFPTGAIDLGSNVQYPDKVYPSGVYCIDGTANIGSGPITLTGNGAHIFKINGALNQAANTDVILTNGAQSSSIIWVLTGATTIGANSHLIGTVNGAPITIGANSDINGVGQPKVMSDAVSGNFGILSSTYTNTLPGTSIAGDIGYTMAPQVPASISGVIHTGDSVYSQAGIAQTAATSFTNSQVCTTNLSGIAVDLSQVNGGVYTPGVYCTTGAASIGAGGITLSGNGIYIFKIDGALTTVSTSNILLTNGAKASLVFWVPTAATTLGANTKFAGTILDASGVTISNNVNILGKVLAFGGTVSTDSDTITVPLFELADAVSGNFQCTITFPTGTIDLGSNVQYPDKVYSPGVYCIDGTANIGSGPITLTGNGAHIFKINGALNQAANTDVILSNGALSSGVIWMPTGPITIGANSNLVGTINGAPITIGANSAINGVGPKIMADALAGNFGILSSTYTNTLPGTSIAGDLGYTTKPAVSTTIDGIVHVADSVYQQAGTLQNTATSYANAQVCTTNLGTTVDLSLVHGGVYTPGVYCTTGAASIGAGGITLSGNGIYIFKIGGALTTVANSSIRLDGAQASNISWVPTGATTLGANSKFAGIILDASGVTINKNVDMTGRVLAFGGTVSTNVDTITVPSYAMADATSGNLPCTVTFPTGTIDLGSNVQYPDKVYPSGVYCIDGALNIGSGPITLTGNGAHIFKINGALNQAANTDVILADGAQVSSIIWVLTGATTIGANSHLIGTVNGAPITIGANSDINGIGPSKTMSDALSGPLYATGDATVPEFGTISTMILAVSIISIIAVSARTRLRITPSY